MLRNLKPRFFEYSKIPVWLSKFAPIEIEAITLGPFIFSRSKMSATTKRHETIHWQQYVETGIIGFLVLYPLFWLWKLAIHRDSSLAYQLNPFEVEAYNNQRKRTYLEKRKRFAWLKHL